MFFKLTCFIDNYSFTLLLSTINIIKTSTNLYDVYRLPMRKMIKEIGVFLLK